MKDILERLKTSFERDEISQDELLHSLKNILKDHNPGDSLDLSSFNQKIVNIGGVEFYIVLADAILQCPWITSVNLRGLNLPVVFLSRLVGADSKLQHINLDNVRCHTTDEGNLSSLGTALSQNRSLESINLSGFFRNSSIGINDILSGLSEIPTLRSLDLSYNILCGKFGLVAKLLKNNQHLKHLSFSHTDFKPGFTGVNATKLSSNESKELAEAIQTHRELELFRFKTSFTAYSDEVLAPLITAIGKCTTLRYATVSNLSMLDILAKSEGKSPIQIIAENHPRLIQDGGKFNLAITYKKYVKHTNQHTMLRLDPPSTLESLRDFTDVLKSKRNIGSVQISCYKLPPEYLKEILESLLQNDSIKELTITDMDHLEHFMYIEEWLRLNRHVEKLSLQSKHLSNPAYAKIVGYGLKDSTVLRELSINTEQPNKSKSTKTGILAIRNLIVPLFNNRTLQRLDLMGSQVPYVDLKSLLEKNTSLRQITGLNLSNVPERRQVTLHPNSSIESVSGYTPRADILFLYEIKKSILFLYEIKKSIDMRNAKNILIHIARWQAFQRLAGNQSDVKPLPADVWHLILRQVVAGPLEPNDVRELFRRGITDVNRVTTLRSLSTLTRGYYLTDDTDPAPHPLFTLPAETFTQILSELHPNKTARNQIIHTQKRHVDSVRRRRENTKESTEPQVIQSPNRFLKMNPARLCNFFEELLKSTSEYVNYSSPECMKQRVGYQTDKSDDKRLEMFKNSFVNLRDYSQKFPNNLHLKILLLIFCGDNLNTFVQCLENIRQMDPDLSKTNQYVEELFKMNAINELEYNWLQMMTKIKSPSNLLENDNPKTMELKERLFNGMILEDASQAFIAVANSLKNNVLEACYNYLIKRKSLSVRSNINRPHSFGVKSALDLQNKLSEAKTVKDIFSILLNHLQRKSKHGYKKAGLKKDSLDIIIIEFIYNDITHMGKTNGRSKSLSEDFLNLVGFDHYEIDPTVEVNSDNLFASVDDIFKNPKSSKALASKYHERLKILTKHWVEWLTAFEEFFGEALSLEPPKLDDNSSLPYEIPRDNANSNQ